MLKSLRLVTPFLCICSCVSSITMDGDPQFLESNLQPVRTIHSVSMSSSSLDSKKEKKLLKSIFDKSYYAERYEKEIHASGLKPFDHFMTFGWQKDYDPNAWFHTKEYKKNFSCEGNPLLDFIRMPMGITPEWHETELVISITSHPPRIGTSWQSILSLLRQSKKANRVILNLAAEDFPRKNLPQSLEILQKYGLEVRYSPTNYKVATKLLPALHDFPEAVIITGDDDRIYHPDLVTVLWGKHMENPTEIIAPSARRYVFVEGSGISGYTNSSKIYPRIDYLMQSMLYDHADFGIFEGFSGVLYPPHALNSEVFNFANFKLLTPCADDVWFQVMALLNGTKVRGLDYETYQQFKWPNEVEHTQESALYHEHLLANDWMAYRALNFYNLLPQLKIPVRSNLRCQSCKRGIWLPTPEHRQSASSASTKIAQKCRTCFNSNPRKILCVGAYDYGNIGDRMYKEVFKHFFQDTYDVFTVPDVARMGLDGRYISMRSDAPDIDYDALIIGGGGILKDFGPNSSIRYYMNQSIQQDKPFFLVSVGIQTNEKHLIPSQALNILGDSAELFRKASLIFSRSVTDFHLLSSVLGEDVEYKIFAKPDLGYLFPQLLPHRHFSRKKYVTLIQTGSASVEIEDVRRTLQAKLEEFSGTFTIPQLIVMNWGGSENPAKAQDYREWNLFAQKTPAYFPNAKIYMGDSISQELKNLSYPTVRVRQSDLTPELAVEIISESHYVITGRYHGEILAKALNVPFESPIFTYKRTAEERSGFDHTRAIDQINYIRFFLDSNSASIPSPMDWNEDQRNSYIVQLHERYPNRSIRSLQAMDNLSLYNLLAIGFVS